MLSESQRIEPTIHWPDVYDRTPAEDRKSYPGDLEPTRKESFESIVTEIEQWGGIDVRISTASQHYADRPNVPHQHDKPDDVGVVAHYLRDGESAEDWHTIAGDCWATQRENARAIALWARRMRLAERCGVTTAQSTHAATALPSGDGEEAIVADGREPHEVLGTAPDADERRVIQAYRDRVKEAHADQGDAPDLTVQEVKAAKEAMLE